MNLIQVRQQADVCLQSEFINIKLIYSLAIFNSEDDMEPWASKVGITNSGEIESEWSKRYADKLAIDSRDTRDAITAVKDAISNLERNKKGKHDINDSLSKIAVFKHEFVIAKKARSESRGGKPARVMDPDSAIYRQSAEIVNSVPSAFRDVAEYIGKNWDSLKNYADGNFRKEANLLISHKCMEQVFADKEKLVQLFNNLADDIEKNKEKYQVAFGLATSTELFKSGAGPSPEFNKFR